MTVFISNSTWVSRPLLRRCQGKGAFAMYKKSTGRALSYRGSTTTRGSAMSTSYFNISEHVFPCQYIREYPGATLNNQEDDFKLHIKQYTPKDNSALQSGAVTIIGAHANGFPKELYEPMWDDLYKSMKQRGQPIRSIWIADVATQGASGIMNEEMLGNDPSWSDHARDLLQMINHFRRDMPRPLVGIGHSMGGNNLVNLALIHPRLLSAVVLIDPVIFMNSFDGQDETPDSGFARLSTFRRDVWPSRAEAAASFKKSRLYRSWDPRVLDRWITYGLRELPTAVYPDASAVQKAGSRVQDVPVTLSTTKHQEVFSFLRPKFEGLEDGKGQTVNRLTHADLDLTQMHKSPFYRPETQKMFENLPYLRPSALYIHGGQSPLAKPDRRKQRMDRTGAGVGGSGGAVEGRVREVVFEDAGHLLALEIVEDLANAIGEWTADELKRWRRIEEEWREKWESRSKAERMMVTDEWKIKIGGDPRGPGTEKL